MSKPSKRPYKVYRMGAWYVYSSASKASADKHAAKLNREADDMERAWALLNARSAYDVRYEP